MTTMTTQTSTNSQVIETEYETPLDDNSVAEYLGRHAEFFSRFPDLLEAMIIPHHSGEAVSLIERQIEVLREKNTRLEAQLHALLDVAHQNNETQEQLHQLMVEMLATTSVDDALAKLTDQLANDLDVDHVEARLFSDQQYPLAEVSDKYLLVGESARESLDSFTPSVEPLCGRLKPSQLKRVFGKRAEQINSCVLIPLRRGTLHGVIALGSEDEHRFNPGMDTLYLKRMGELVSAALIRLLE